MNASASASTAASETVASASHGGGFHTMNSVCARSSSFWPRVTIDQITLRKRAGDSK